MLKDLEAELAKFQYVEKAVPTKEEVAILKEMFSVEGSFKALFRYMCILESERGTQMMYDIEQLPTDGHITDREIADMVRFKKFTVQFVKWRMETLRNEFAVKAQDKVTEEEKKIKEEKEAKENKILADREKNEAVEKEVEQEKKGVSPDM